MDLAALVSTGPPGRGSQFATNVTETMAKAPASTKPIRIFLTECPSRLDWMGGVVGQCRLRCSYRLQEFSDERKHGRHHGLGVEIGIDGAAPEHAVGDHHEGLDRRG